MNSICQQCKGKCCVDIIEVYSNDEIFYDESLVESRQELEYDRAMRITEQGVCIALVDGKCSIYDKRPTVCRQFEVNSECCRKFRSGQLTSKLCKECRLKV